MIEALTDIIGEAAALALSRQQAIAQLRIAAKGHLDFVTDADRAVEEMIAARVARLFPEDGFLGEEGRRLSGRSGRTWIVDPIDGTHNFIRGSMSWAVSVGIASDAAVGAAVFAPAMRTLLVAEAGKGVWHNGERLPDRRKPEQFSVAYTGVSTWMSTNHDHWLTEFVRGELGLADRRTGSAVTSLIAVILGEADLYIGFGEHIWDVAGGAIIAGEAGYAHSLDWSADLPEGPTTFVCGEPSLVERSMKALQARAT